MVFNVGSSISQVYLDVVTWDEPFVGKSSVLQYFSGKLLNGFLSSCP